jgi:predicted amidophosphoribosyltransferase
MDKLVRLKAAAAMEKAAESSGESGAGLGMGMGLMMPAMFSSSFMGQGSKATSQQPEAMQGVPGQVCPDCKLPVSADSRFCYHCGHQIVVFTKCTQCGKNLSPNAKFCSRCGNPASHVPTEKICSGCQAKNLPESMFCNQCGEKMS